MRSMTGFGNAEGKNPELGIALRMELSSINRKQFELKCSLPRELSMFENDLRMLISSRVSRGSLLLRVELIPCGGGKGDPDAVINYPLAVRLASVAADLQKQCGLADIKDAIAVLAIPAVSENAGLNFAGPALEKLMMDTASQALDNLHAMRSAEGSRLKPDFESRLLFLEKMLSEIEPLVRKLPELQYSKLLSRAQEAGFAADPSDERFLRELVIFTDKSDVTEEIVRLKSHFTHFHELLAEEKEAVGRTLDFLTQEIFREVNTLGNKAPLPEVSRRIVSMKTEVEKIREQVQNVE